MEAANDSEVARKKHSLIFTNADLSGTIDNKTITQIFSDKGIERPKLFTKVILKWKE